MKTYKIHLIRHGLTDANERGLYIGRTDLPLSPAGLSRLLEMKKAGGYPPARRFFTSPLLRCRQTLEVLYPGCKAEILPGLSECDFGEWEGKSVHELKADERFQEWIAGRRQEIPGGESAQVFQERVTAEFEQLVETLMRAGDTDAVVCTHGGVVMLLMAKYALPRQPLQAWAGPDGGGFTLRVTPGIWMREPVAEAVCELPKAAEPRS